MSTVNQSVNSIYLPLDNYPDKTQDRNYIIMTL